MRSLSILRRIRILWLALCISPAFQVALWGQQGDTTRIAAPVTEASRTAARFDTSRLNIAGTVELYGKEIGRMGPGEDRARLSLELASVLETGAASQARPDWLQRSNQIYREVIASSRGEIRLRASSNYCAQLLRQDRPQEAVQLMASEQGLLRDSSLDRVARSRSLYNYGRALQLSGDFERAYQVLREAVEADPTFAAAARAAGDAAVRSRHETTGIPLMVALTDSQLSHQDYDNAGRNLRQGLLVERWRGHHLYPQLLRQLVRYFTAAQIGRDAFVREWLPLLSKLRSTVGLDGASRQMIEQIEAVYVQPLAIMEVDPERIRDFYAVWADPAELSGRGPDFTLLSNFIGMVADKYYRQKSPENLRRALERYCHAWALDTQNMEAGLYLANLLLYDQRSSPRRLDPDNRILNSFVGQLFRTKGREYSRDLGRDYERILKYHVILATIFEGQQRWGPESEPNTALFQWELAQRALDRLDSSSSTVRRLLAPVVSAGLQRARENYRPW